MDTPHIFSGTARSTTLVILAHLSLLGLRTLRNRAESVASFRPFNQVCLPIHRH
jgi:hypothetical protein